MQDHDTSRPLPTPAWEARLGRQLRELREQRGWSQTELARRANVDRTTIVRLEQGGGGSIGTLVRVVRALDREAWLDALVPPASTVSPLQVLREQQASGARRRRRS
jgi:transcriptional regulator with XRE-family HTH domain